MTPHERDALLGIAKLAAAVMLLPVMVLPGGLVWTHLVPLMQWAVVGTVAEVEGPDGDVKTGPSADGGRTDTPGSEPSATPARETPAGTEPAAPIDVPWLAVGLAVGGAGTLAGGGYGGTALVRRRRRRLAAEAELAENRRRRWERALARHDAVRDAYGGIRLDPIEAINHMPLWDVTDARTAAFTVAYGRATDLRSAAGDEVPGVEATVDAYAAAVDACEEAWQDARRHAAVVGIAVLPPGERSAARRAVKLLRTARDSAAAAPERALAAARASDLLAGVRRVLLPEEAATQLEAAAAPALRAS